MGRDRPSGRPPATRLRPGVVVWHYGYGLSCNTARLQEISSGITSVPTPYKPLTDPIMVQARKGGPRVAESTCGRPCRLCALGASGVKALTAYGPSERDRGAKEWMGNRRRRTRRDGAVAAFERQTVPTPRKDEVSSTVTAGSARAPSRRSARVPGAMRSATRDGRGSRDRPLHRHAIALAIAIASTTDGSPRIGSGAGVRSTLPRPPSAAKARASREARARTALPPQHRRRESKRAAPPPPVAGDDDAARDALRPRPRARGCRAGARGRRGSR